MAAMGGLLARDHEAQPDSGTVRDSMGHEWADICPHAMPATGICRHCGVPVRLDSWFLGDWRHDYFLKIPAVPGEQSGGASTGNEDETAAKEEVSKEEDIGNQDVPSR